MVIEKKLDVPASKFFDLLAESALADLKQYKPDVTALSPGLNYRKQILTKLGQQATVNVTIADYQAPSLYTAQFESVRGINTLCYSITADTDTTCLVTVSEAFKGRNSFADTNQVIMGFLMKKRTHKRLDTMLDAMAAHIKANK